MSDISVLLPAAIAMKRKILDRGLREAQATCPRCATKNSLRLALAGRRNHLRLRCTAPGCNIMMME
jgi:hypothetical protein